MVCKGCARSVSTFAPRRAPSRKHVFRHGGGQTDGTMSFGRWWYVRLLVDLAKKWWSLWRKRKCGAAVLASATEQPPTITIFPLTL